MAAGYLKNLVIQQIMDQSGDTVYRRQDVGCTTHFDEDTLRPKIEEFEQ